jgi:hypothetical protein
MNGHAPVTVVESTLGTALARRQEPSPPTKGVRRVMARAPTVVGNLLFSFEPYTGTRIRIAQDPVEQTRL